MIIAQCHCCSDRWVIHISILLILVNRSSAFVCSAMGLLVLVSIIGLLVFGFKAHRGLCLTMGIQMFAIKMSGSVTKEIWCLILARACIRVGRDIGCLTMFFEFFLVFFFMFAFFLGISGAALRPIEKIGLDI